VTGVPGRSNTIKKITSAGYSLEQIVRIAYTHKIARTISREDIVEHFENAPHIRLGLAHAQPSDAEAGPVPDIHELTSVLAPKVVEDVALEHR
jgi:hypothetical protein